MGKIIYETKLNRYLVAQVTESTWSGEVLRYEVVDSYAERADAIAKADERRREWPNDRYVVIDSEADDE